MTDSTDFDAQVWADMEKAISCGYCGNATTVESPFACSSCGRILCDECGERWGWCKDHVPVCSHPELLPTRWNQERPEAAAMTGSCKHNMICPVCGSGWGCAPDPCDVNKDDPISSLATLLGNMPGSQEDWEALIDEPYDRLRWMGDENVTSS